MKCFTCLAEIEQVPNLDGSFTSYCECEEERQLEDARDEMRLNGWSPGEDYSPFAGEVDSKGDPFEPEPLRRAG